MGIFSTMFGATSRGIPDTYALPQSTTMSYSYYICSLLLQVAFFIYFSLNFGMSIYRFVKKIKNRSCREIVEYEAPQHNENGIKENQIENDFQGEDRNKCRDEDLIYRFDEEENEEQYQQQKQEESNVENVENLENLEINQKKQSSDSNKEEKLLTDNKGSTAQQDFDEYHDANEQPFINLLSLQPFFIGFIIANNLFQADALLLSSFVLFLCSFYFINIKGYFSRSQLSQMVFMIFALVPYISFFKGDHDITT